MNSPSIKWLATAGILYFLIAKFGMVIFSLQPSNVTLLWLPSGIGLIMCLKAGRRALPWIFAASFLANLSGMTLPQFDLTILHTGIAALTDTASVYLSSLILSRMFPKGLQNAIALLKFCLYVCLIPNILCSLALTSNLVYAQYITQSEAYLFFMTFIVSNVLGILLIYPLYISWNATPIQIKNFTPALVLYFLMTFALVYIAFSYAVGVIYLVPPLLALMAYFKEERCLHILSLMTVILLMIMTSQNLGPFALADIDQSISALSFFVFSMIIMPYSIQLYTHELQATSQERDDWMTRASLDALTGLTNRYGFLPKLEKELHRSQRYHHPFVFAMADIDHFKKINDKYGHLVGDEVLKQMADVLRHELRDHDYICRFGGEEIALLLPETDMNEAIAVFERLRKTIEEKHFRINDIDINFTISLGATEYKGENMTLNALLDIADKRLYKAKANGRNQLVYQD